MKKYIYPFVYALCIVYGLTACDDFLDDQPRGNAIAETTDDYNGLFNANQFMSINGEDYSKWLNPDILLTKECADNLPTTAMYGVSTFFSTSSVRAYSFQTDIYDPQENCNLWEGLFSSVYTFNVIVNGVMESQGGSEAKKRALQAEARMSRAWMHFIIAQIFAPPYSTENANKPCIPIVRTADSNQKDFPLATMQEVYDFIETDLSESCELLEDRPDHNMRVYKTTGLALLGKYYWITGQYEKALQPLRQAYSRLKNETGFHLMDFNSLQAPYGYKEMTPLQIYSMGSTASSMIPYAFNHPEILWVKQNNNFWGAFGLYHYGLVTYYLTPELYSLFGDNDLRRNLIPTKDNNGQPYPYPVGCIRDVRENYGVEMADVYMGLAECEARVGDTDNARSVLREFRSSRMRTGYEDIPSEVQSKNDLIRFCVDEQRREFAGRQCGVYNLRRLWNDPLFQDRKPYTHFDGTNTYTMKEENLYLRFPETLLKWNESWRNAQ